MFHSQYFVDWKLTGFSYVIDYGLTEVAVLRKINRHFQSLVALCLKLNGILYEI